MEFSIANLPIFAALIPVFPIVAFMLIALWANRSHALTTTIAMVGMGLALLLSWAIVFNVVGIKDLGNKPLTWNFPWLATGDKTFNIGTVLDPLNVTFLFMVPLAAFLIFLYSTSYMGKDPRYTRFMGYLSLFAGSMLGLVVSDNLLSFFIFWELMGFCSYALIGFFYNKPSAYKAAVKAFMTTRVGDMFLLMGMVYLYWQTGTLNFFDIFHNAKVLEHLAEVVTPVAGISAASLIALLIFGGTVGKSAQFPLHVWLPDAMEGPTPVSAMIHAATMVSAGILLSLRIFPLIEATHEVNDGSAFMVIGLIGAITALIGALIAVGQYDIKRVLAYSTISQLGFMVAAIGIGAYIAAAFHLLTHAFFKALLFLGSGSVIHGVEHGHHHVAGHGAHGPRAAHAPQAHGVDAHGADAHAVAAHDTHAAHGHDAHDDHAFDAQDMRNYGGLRKRMPLTFVTFLIGGLALIGTPFITAGFWSKDEIIADAFAKAPTSPIALLVLIVLLIAATLTAFYTTRQILLTFFGSPRTEAAAHATENDWRITVPLMVLSVFALLGGYFNVPSDFPVFGNILAALGGAEWLKKWLMSMLIVPEKLPPFNIIPVALSILVWAVGGAIGLYLYGGKNALKAGEADPVTKLGGVFTFLNNRMYFDELYRTLFINPLQRFADAYAKYFDKIVIDGIIMDGGWSVGSGIAGLLRWLDENLVTGISNAFGSIFRWFGTLLRPLQSGQIQGYLSSGIGLGLLAVAVLFALYASAGGLR